MRWYPFTVKEAALLLLVFAASGLFSYIQPWFVTSGIRPFTYVLVLLLLLLMYFPAIKPEDPQELAQFLAIIFGVIFGVLILVKEIIIRQNYSWQSGILFAGAILCPLIAGWLYRLTLPHRARTKK